MEVPVRADAGGMVGAGRLPVPVRRAHRAGGPRHPAQTPSRAERIARRSRPRGYPAYSTGAGWLGYSDEKLVRLAKQAVADGFTMIKLKVGGNLDDDMRRMRLARDGRRARTSGSPSTPTSAGTSSPPSSGCARSPPFDPYWIEEPTSPDDVLGAPGDRRGHRADPGRHRRARAEPRDVQAAPAGRSAVACCRLDAARVGGVNENIAILLLAAKFGVPVCPHAGGVGLCELVRHLSMFDYVAVSGTQDDRAIEWVDHLHEHFTDPAVVRGGRYLRADGSRASPRASDDESLARYAFPDGPEWSDDSDRLRRPDARWSPAARPASASATARPARRARRDGRRARPQPGRPADVRLSAATCPTTTRSARRDRRGRRAVGGIDVLVNNAGIGAQGDVTANDDAEWHRVLDVNVRRHGPRDPRRAAAPEEVARRGRGQHLLDRRVAGPAEPRAVLGEQGRGARR